MRYRILVVDDDDSNLRCTEGLLKEWDYYVETATSGAEGLAKLTNSEKGFAVVLMDYKMPRLNGAETAVQMRAHNSETTIIVYSCDTSREALKDAFRAGAVDFIDKSESPDTLKLALDLACKKYDESLRIHRATVNKAYNFDLLKSVGMIGHSQKMADVVKQCLVFRQYQAPVMIVGETGAGKELVAKAIHGGQPEQFFAINCAAFPEGTSLVESELFGYEKGAFTGAGHRKVGILEAAGRGTVFLDELHHLSLAAQGALLRAIREKRIRRVGGTQEYGISCRILAATKPDITRRVDENKFLPDLYYRLKFLTIDVPALRERPEDIGILVDYFCKKHDSETGEKHMFRASTIRVLESYGWPGNVGELEGCVANLLISTPHDVIGPADLDQRFRAHALLQRDDSTFADLKQKHDEETRTFLSAALSVASTQRQAAERLKINESTLRSLIDRFKIHERQP